MQRRDRWIEIERWDGEVLVGDLVYVSEPTEEVLYDMVSTNRPERYRDRWIGFHVFSLPFDEIASVRLPVA